MKFSFLRKLNNLDKRTETLISVLICAAILCIFIALIASKALRRYPEARRDMRHFMDRVQLGDTKAQVQQTFDIGEYQSLKLKNDYSQTLWSIRTPIEFGAGNWLLYIEFEKDRVVAL